MASVYSFSISKPSDDEELKQLMKEISMPGPISLAFCCEPSFFQAKNVGCIKSETMICRRNDTGKIVGFGSRSLWPVYYKGVKKTIWYLHSLRAVNGERGGLMFLRAYKFLHSLPNESDFPFYLTTILDDNLYAKKVLEGARFGMPIYSKINEMTTHLIPLRQKERIKNNLDVERCSETELNSAIDCINNYCLNKDMSTCIDFNKTKDFSITDLYISLSEKKVNGTIGVWNQNNFKQTIVKSYSKNMKMLRYLYNLYSYFSGLPYLPKEGGKINMVFASFIGILNDNPNVFKNLIEKIICDWSGCGYDWLALGLIKSSPFEKLLNKYSRRKIFSSVYLVYWDEDNVVLPEIESLNLEISFL